MAKLCAAGVTLRDQINRRFPKRDKSSDGWVGDARHQARDGWGTNGKGSYHTPDPRGIVHAIDIDEDFGAPGDAMKFAKQLADYCRTHPYDKRIAHIVYEDKCASPGRGWKFTGSGFGHTAHIHISFTNQADNNGKKFPLPIFDTPKK